MLCILSVYSTVSDQKIGVCGGLPSSSHLRLYIRGIGANSILQRPTSLESTHGAQKQRPKPITPYVAKCIDVATAFTQTLQK